MMMIMQMCVSLLCSNKESLSGELLKKYNLVVLFMPQMKYSQLEVGMLN